MAIDIEKPQEKIEIYYRKFDTWANSTVRVGTVAGTIAGGFFAIAVIFLVFGHRDVTLVSALFGTFLFGFLSYVAVRHVYAIIVDRVSVKFIVYTDAKAEQFFIDALPARDATTAMKETLCLKIIEQGDSSGLSIISGKLEDLPGNQKVIDGEGIAKDDNLSAKWQAIKEAMAVLAKKGSGYDGGSNSNALINEALEIASFPEKGYLKQ